MCSYSTSNRLIQNQNDISFELDINKEAPIFKKKLFEKVLNPPQENKNVPRTCTIKCLAKGCSQKWTNQKIKPSTSNFITHYKTRHKAIPILSILSVISDDELDLSSYFNETVEISDNPEIMNSNNQNTSDDVTGIEAKSTTTTSKLMPENIRPSKDSSPLIPILIAVEQLRKGAADIVVRSKFIEERAEQLERALKQALERMSRKRKFAQTEENQNAAEVSSDLVTRGGVRVVDGEQQQHHHHHHQYQQQQQTPWKRGRFQRHCKRCGKSGHNTRTCAVQSEQVDNNAVEIEQTGDRTTSK
ncbi:hypothetical protein OnM2_047016 [Erysiphe neolycopersici]|uniref:CCHC-type domain-containing protein n=1 Tax=Erysiphe neolycopersici TaxID=212602 RepID=A0A420HTU3_9PEZI|nr:hypothetical protein OnM2_047016 [Erysiphe neolycopersici]